MKPVAKVIIYAVLGIWSLVCLLPIYWVTITSFKGLADIDKPPGYVPFLDFAPSLDAWRFIFFEHNENLISRLFNSAVIGVGASALTLAVSGMAIYALTRFPSTIRWATMASFAAMIGLLLSALSASSAALRTPLLAGAVSGLGIAFALRNNGPIMSTSGAVTLMLATRALPPVVLVIPIYMMAIATGTRDTLTAMIFVYTAINIPVALWLLLPVFGSRATEQEEAAQLDGASHLAILFGIVFPMLRANVAAAGFVVFLMCWNEYLFAAYLTADHALTLPPWEVGQLSIKEAQVGGEAEELAHLSAATVLMILPALALGAFVQKQISRSIPNTKSRNS